MAVVKIIEVLGTSPNSFDEAIKSALARTAKTVKNITGVKVVGWNAGVKDGKIAEYKVNLKIAFTVE